MMTDTRTLKGLMQHWPLTTDKIIDHAARFHGEVQIVSRLADGTADRWTYAELRRDALRLSNALLAKGLGPGDRVATLAMNGARHLSAWYAISGIGAVCHTLNPRYSDEQLQYITTHAGDRLILADGAFAPLLARLWPLCPAVEKVVFLSNWDTQLKFPAPVSSYEEYIADASDHHVWGGFEEDTAAGLCYTSGTTGLPKGVLYSHRSNFLHVLLSIQPDMFNLSARDVLMPVVPMYHANAWGMAFSAPFVGAKLVLPGAQLDGASICELITTEGVTVAAGVPTVWLTVLDHIREKCITLPSLKRIIVGGAALSERLYRDYLDIGIEAIHAWGMTEMSPTAGVAMPTASIAQKALEDQLPWRLKQGRPPCGVELRIVDEGGRELSHDGTSMGALQVRGPTIASEYFDQPDGVLTRDGFLDCGDIATIDSHGFVKITDRAKDIIKSGGEWISSLDIENAALTHPAVSLAAVIGKLDPKWDERPALILQLNKGAFATVANIKGHLSSRLPRWWIPDEVFFIDNLPVGSTGKIDKKQLRLMYADHSK